MWNGIFKSYAVIKIIPLSKMSKEHWRILEWEGLRNKAKNRIAESATDLVGFAEVSVFDKGIGKPIYYWPATKEDVRRFRTESDIPFRNESDEEALKPITKLIDSSQSILSPIIKTIGAGLLIRWIAEHEDVKYPETTIETTPIVVADNPPQPKFSDEGSKFPDEESKTLWEEFQELEAGGIEDYNELDAALVIALELVKYKGFEWLEDFIDEATEAIGWAEEKGLI